MLPACRPPEPHGRLCVPDTALPACLPPIRNAGFDFVSLANNHSLDYREAGLAETRRVLHAAGIACAGAGRAEEAAAPAILERAGLKLAFLSYAGEGQQGAKRVPSQWLHAW